MGGSHWGQRSWQTRAALYWRAWAIDPMVRRSLGIALPAISLVGLLALVLFAQIPSLFRIDARTETLTVVLRGTATEWRGVQLPRPAPPGCTPAAFVPAAGATLTVTRVGAGPALIDVIGPGGAAAGRFDCDETFSQANAAARVGTSLVAVPGTALPVLAFTGGLVVGSDPGGGATPPLLGSGRVTVETARSLLGGGTREETQDLVTGDRVEFLLAPDRLATMSGFVVVDLPDAAGRGVRLLARGRARSATFVRYGEARGETAVLAPSLFARLNTSAEYVLVVPILWLLFRLWGALDAGIRGEGREARSRAARLRRRLRRSALAAGVAAAAIAPVQASVTVGSLSVGSQRGQAVTYPDAGRCRVLTAGHVAENSQPGTLRLGTRDVPLAFRLSTPVDVALYEGPAGDLSACPDPVDFKGVADSIDRGGPAMIEIAGPGGTRAYINGQITGSGPTSLTFEPTDGRADKRLERGISGAALKLGGKVVGIVTRVSDDQTRAYAARLDNVATEIATAAAKPKVVDTAAARPPYDTSWMRPEMRTAINSAIGDYNRGNEAAKRARELSDKAKAIAGTAKPLVTGADWLQLPRNGAYSFAGPDGARYAGQIRVHVYPDGRQDVQLDNYGTGSPTTGALAGEQMSGLFEIGQLRNGVVITGPAKTANNGFADRYEGEFQTSGYFGSNGAELVGNRQYIGRVDDRGVVVSGGQFNSDDSNIIITTWDKTGTPDGWYVTWDSKGAFVSAGRFAGGKQVETVSPAAP